MSRARSEWLEDRERALKRWRADNYLGTHKEKMAFLHRWAELHPRPPLDDGALAGDRYAHAWWVVPLLVLAVLVALVWGFGS